MMNTLHHGDCFDIMPTIPANTVDLILTDIPYGMTYNSWDSKIDLDKMWNEFKRVTKTTATVVFTAQQPFTTDLINSFRKGFRYCWVWEKHCPVGQLNIKYRPLRAHEDIVVFTIDGKPHTYNPQMVKGKPYKATRLHNSTAQRSTNYAPQKTNVIVNNGTRYPRSVLKVKNLKIKGQHPTAKPLELMEYFVKTYSNPGDLVLDPFMGAGTTPLAAKSLGRNYIGIELMEEYFNKAMERVK